MHAGLPTKTHEIKFSNLTSHHKILNTKKFDFLPNFMYNYSIRMNKGYAYACPLITLKGETQDAYEEPPPP